jgi:hypothetical protein
MDADLMSGLLGKHASSTAMDADLMSGLLGKHASSTAMDASLMSRLLEKHPSSTAMDAILRRSLRETDAELDILQDQIIRKMSSSFGNSDNPATVRNFLADECTLVCLSIPSKTPH